MDVELLSVCRHSRTDKIPPNTVKFSEAEKERIKKALLAKTTGHKNPSPELTTFGIKLGWIQGVLIPCLLNIWGVMLFLRISWIVAQAGIGFSVLIILVSGIVCLITTSSLSAICTNGELEGGGVYYLVSRSLGAELGASVGLIFAFANAVTASMNTIGFCDSLNELLRSHGAKILDNGMNDTRIIGSIALLVMCLICAVGMDWESKTQNFLIVVIVVAIANYIIGVAIGPRNAKQIAQGFVGVNLKTAKENWAADFRKTDGVKYDLFSVFAMYFPAVTGVQAGANICGDLKDPAKAIPKGTFLAVIITLTSYLMMAVLSGMGALRDASGVTDKSNVSHQVPQSCKPNCHYGLHNDYGIMQLMSLWPPLIYAGCWAATLSTALTNLLSVPRLIQALGMDRIYPGLIFFSKPYGKYGEPYRGYVLTFFVSLAFLLIADLNMIAPLISNFYLASYAMINFCTFHAAFVRSLNWRPTYHIYNEWLSLFGFILCLGIMIVISWIMALVTVLVIIVLYLLVVYTKPDTTWGSSTETKQYNDTVSKIIQLSHQPETAKTYNPQILVLAGKPYARPALLDVGHIFTKQGSFMIVADIEPSELTPEARKARARLGEAWVQSRADRALYVVLHGFQLEAGARAMMQGAGLGRLSPNIVLLGFKQQYEAIERADIDQYVAIIRIAFDDGLSVIILRAPASTKPRAMSQGFITSTDTSSPALRPGTSHAQLQLSNIMATRSNESIRNGKETSLAPSQSKLNAVSQQTIKDVKTPMHRYEQLNFDASKPIDAWWLYNDGGINILLPYIIAQRGFKEKRIFRIFVLARADLQNDDAEKQMRQLLARFRIDYNELRVVSGIDNEPAATSWQLFKDITAKLHDGMKISEEELKRQRAPTSRHLRVREMLLEYSTGASFIVLTLPVPRKGISSCLYTCWLDVMSTNMPPVLFVRGNERAVLDT